VKYGWDWNGDGTVDEWSSLAASGTKDSRSHSWNSTGTYNVTVKAEDECGAQSEISQPLQVVITTGGGNHHQPNIEITSITGSFGISAAIKSNGTAAATNVSWWINVTGGIIFSGRHSSNVIAELAVNASKTIKSSGLWGIGSVTITVQVDDKHKNATAFLLGPLVLGLKQQ
jgi:hypothetical protein